MGYKREEVLRELCDKVGTVCSHVYTSSRPSATERMNAFVVVRLSQGISPYAGTHHIATVQFICHVRDRAGGLERVDNMETLTSGLLALLPFNDALMSCNEKALLLDSKSDGMGFHASVIQFRIIIKL